MANFDVLSGRLLLDTSAFVRGLQQASSAMQVFSQRLEERLQQARREIEQLSASTYRLALPSRPLPQPKAAPPWSEIFAGPAATFNSPSGTTSQAALMGFVLQVNHALEKQAQLADELADAVARARAALQESSGHEEMEKKLEEAAKKLSEAVEEALDKVAEAVEKLTDALDELVDKLEEAADKVEELTKKIEELGEKSEEADEKVEKLGEKAEELGEKSDESAEKVEKLAEKIEELGEKVKEFLKKLPAGALGGAGAKKNLPAKAGQGKGDKPGQVPAPGFSKTGGGANPKTPWEAFLDNPAGFIASMIAAYIEGGISDSLVGTQNLQDLIDAKKAAGDQLGAIDLVIQNLKMRLQQSMLNLHQLSIDPAAGGGFGGFPGSDNSAYFLTLDTPLTREIKSLQAQLDQLEKQRHDLAGHGAPKKMASGGIVSGATAAVVGEAGPEAVLPLSSFANMLGSLPVFSNINAAMEGISDSLAAQGRTGEANRWDQMLNRVQSSFDYVSNFVENARRIDLRPQGMLRPLTQGMLMDQEMAARNQAYRIGGLTTGDLALHFHGVDISDTGAARQFAQQLLPALELEARSLGQDMTGRSVFRSPNMTGPGTPGRPYGFAR